MTRKGKAAVKVKPVKQGYIYPWPLWQNGRWHTARQGIDFHRSLHCFLTSLRMRAKKFRLRFEHKTDAATGTVKFRLSQK